MRTLLHTRRSRKRSIAAATLGALALLGSMLVATPAQALNDTGTGGVFVSTAGRVLDTKNNIGGYNTPMPAGGWRTVKVTGTAGLPDDGTVGAVSLVATVADIPGQGQLTGRPDVDTSSTLMGIYGGANKANTSFSSVLAVAADGTIQVKTETSVRLILDVQGYYTANTDGTAAGGFVPSNGKRVADSRSGTGIPKAQLTSGKTATLQVTGIAGVPAGASAVIVNLIALNSTSSVGYLTPYASDAARPANSFNYAGSVITTMQAQVPLSADGKITIYNANSTIDLAIDLQGYFTAAGTGGAMFTPGQGRIVDTRSTGGNLAGNETRAIDVAGKAGVPVMGSGINAVVLTLTSIATNGGGWARVWANGTTEPDTASLRYEDGTIRSNTVTVPLGANGKISLHNIGAGATNFVIDVQGWYSQPRSPQIRCAAPYSAGAWVTDMQALAAGAQCSFNAPAATATGQYLEVFVNDLPEVSFPLSETGPSTYSYTFSNLIGITTLSASVNDETTDTPSVQYKFGVGQWERQSLVPSLGDGTVTDQDVVLAPGLFESVLIPADAEIEYRVTDETAGVTFTKAIENDSLALGPDFLAQGHNYSWSTAVRAANSLHSSFSLTSGQWHFRVAADGEAPTEPQADQAGSNTMSTMAAPNGCTGVPDRYFKANFKPSCDKHDICYGKNSKTSRKNCDIALRQNLIGSCFSAYGKGAYVSGCVDMAWNYYNGVRLLGKNHYVGKGSNA